MLLTVEWSIFMEFLAAPGKTDALFGITGFSFSPIRFILSLGGLVAFVIAIRGGRRKEAKQQVNLAMLMSLLVLLAPFIGMWDFLI